MNTIQKLSVAASLLGLGAVGQANAYCTVTGKIVQGYSVSSTYGNYSYFYITPLTTAFSGFNWYFYVPAADAPNLAQLTSANAGGHTVTVTGDATACPTTGTYRYGGQLGWLSVYPRN